MISSKLDLGSPAPARAVAILSGGLDSTVLTYVLHQAGVELKLLSFDYGQRHRGELEFARRTADELALTHHVVDLTGLLPLLSGSALTDPYVGVPDGHYTDESMRATVVPNRNAIMLDVAVARAVVVRADAVAFGAHCGDHPIYPDCRPTFVSSFEQTARLANEGFAHPQLRIVAPFLELTKADIVRLGQEVGVPFTQTWSCYKGDRLHCGSCGTCVERREAFALAGIADPTEYAGPES